METITITIDEYNELKEMERFIEDQGFTVKFMMYQDIIRGTTKEEEDLDFEEL